MKQYYKITQIQSNKNFKKYFSAIFFEINSGILEFFKYLHLYFHITKELKKKILIQLDYKKKLH